MFKPIIYTTFPGNHAVKHTLVEHWGVIYTFLRKLPHTGHQIGPLFLPSLVLLLSLWLICNCQVMKKKNPSHFHGCSRSYTHWFDGMALMHRFHISGGTVTYSSRFLQSTSYVTNSERNRILVSEFGTLAMPDPCKNIFARFFSRFQVPSTWLFLPYFMIPKCRVLQRGTM